MSRILKSRIMRPVAIVLCLSLLASMVAGAPLGGESIASQAGDHASLTAMLRAWKGALEGIKSAMNREEWAELPDRTKELKNLAQNLRQAMQTVRQSLSGKGGVLRDRYDRYWREFFAASDECLSLLDEVRARAKDGDLAASRRLRDVFQKKIGQAKKKWLGASLAHLSLGDTTMTGGALVSPLLPPGIGDGAPGEADLALTLETKPSAALRAKVRELGRDPVRIYEFVRNKVDYEPYYGSMKGADKTLADLAGNDLDQAALLTAMLRLANVPARFALGRVRLQINQAQRWLGAKSPPAVLAMLERNGIPVTPLVSGGSYTGLELDHAWVRAYLPVLPDRSVKERLGEPVWVDLDPSCKNTILEPRQDLTAVVGVDPRALLGEVRVESTSDQAAGTATGVPQELLLGRIAAWGQTILRYADANGLRAADLGQRTRTEQQNLGTLPLGQSWEELESGVYAEIPDVLRHKLTLSLADLGGGREVSTNIPLRELFNKKVLLKAKPATADDEQLLAEMVGDMTLPAYLIEVVPQIALDDEILLTGAATGLGQTGLLRMEFSGPTTGSRRLSHEFTAGSASALVIEANGLSVRESLNSLAALRRIQSVLAGGGKSPVGSGLGDALATVGRAYFHQLDELNKLAAAALDVRYTRHPSVLLASVEIAAEEVYGVPFAVKAETLTIDVEQDLVSPVSRGGDWVKEKQFLAVSGLTASALEHGILEEVLGGNAVSTMRVLEVANQLRVPIHTIKPDRVEAALTALDPEVRSWAEETIRDAANAGWWTIIPRQQTQFAGWRGIGCIVLDPYTNAASYLVTGGLQGGLHVLAALPPAALLAPSGAAGLRTLVDKTLAWCNILQTSLDQIRWSYLPAVASVADWLRDARNMDEVTTIAAVIVISGPIGKVCETLSVVNVRCYPELFSPNNDGAVDSVLFTADLTREASWQILVRDATGLPQKTATGLGRRIVLNWAGEIDSGPALASGEYTLQVMARDLVTGQEAASPLTLVTADLTPPEAVMSEPAAGASLRGVARILGIANDLHFSRFSLECAPGDGSEGGWQVLAANTQPVIDNALYFWDTAGIENGPYTLRLTVYDSAGNMSVLTRSCLVDNPAVDRTPPICKLIKPTAGETLSGRAEMVAEASDDVGLAGVEFLVDGWVVGDSPTSPFSMMLETALFSAGEHKLSARATDLAGHTTDSPSVPVIFGGLIREFRVEPNPFSPNNDGQKDTTTISAKLSAAADWRVDIIEQDGAGEVEASRTGSGTVIEWIWDGGGVPTGSYLVRLTAGGETAEKSVFVNAAGEKPIAVISAPADGVEVSGVVKILGTATDADFSHYELKYRRQGASAWTLLVDTQTPVVDGLLGQFDGTLLGNDFYDIELTTWDRAGAGAVATVTVALTGDLKIGNFAFTLVDMQVNVGDLPVAIIRSYDTLNKDVAADYGYGWKYTLSTVELKEDYYHSIMVTMPDGRRARFAFTPNFPAGGYQQTLAYTRYSQATGFPDKLSCLDVPVVMFIDGEYYVPGEYGGVDVFRPRSFKLEAADGNVYYIDRDAGVTKMVDRNGQTVTITPTSVRHSSGAEIRIERDGAGRITKATDPAGASVSYEYDGQGDLTAATDLSGRRVTYTYVGHALTGIFDADGQQILANEYDQSGRLAAIKDAAGKAITVNHDLAARKETVTDRNGNPTVYGYDQSGRVVSMTDALGNTWTYAYDQAGHKLMETDPLGRATYWTYAPNGEVASITDPAGNSTGNVWSSVMSPSSTGFVMLLTATKDALGRVTSYGYDSRGNLTSMRDPLGNTSTLTMDGAGQLTAFTDPLGGSYQFIYTNGLPTRTTDPLGNVTDTTYDAAGRVKTETRHLKAADGTQTPVKTEYVCDTAGRVTKVIHPDGNEEITEYNEKGQVKAKISTGRRTSYEYDGLGQLWKTTYPDGTYEESKYDANGNRTSFRSRDGRQTAYVYDAVNRLVKTIHPDGSCTETRYDGAGQVEAEVDVRGGVTGYVYDDAGRRIKTIDPLGHETRYAYDAAGNVTAVTDMRGTVTTNEYDAANRLVRVTLPDGNRIAYEYDAAGRRIGQTDQLMNRTAYAYDALGRLIAVTDALGNATRYEYDGAGRMTAQIDALGRMTRFAYDIMGRVLEKVLPLGQKESYEYNADGTLKAKTDANGVKTSYTYDPITAQLLSRAYSTGGRVDYTYYPDGSLKTAANSSGTISYEYDVMGRLARLSTPSGKIISYEYDKAGNRTKIVAPHGIVQYDYDIFGRIETVADQAGKVTRYTYDDLGRQAKAVYGNGTETLYGFDVLNRLTSVINRKVGGEVITSHEYSLDAVGNRTEIREQGSTVRYVYDKLYRLVEEHRTGDLAYDAVYSYDAVGNRLTKTAMDGNFTYDYDDNDRLLNDGIYIYTWDGAGRMTGKTGSEGTTTYSYDSEDRLVEASGPEGHVSFAYDAMGNRISRTTNTGTTAWLIDPNMPYAQVLEETAGGATKVYAYGNDLLSVDGPDGTRWFAYDGLGSTRALTDAGGAWTDAYDYEAFGSVIRRTGTTGNDFLFTGEQWEPGAGMYYLRARYYEPAVGRFGARDPWQGNRYLPYSIHKYLYTFDNPPNNTDPTGLFSLAELSIVQDIQGILRKLEETKPGRILTRGLRNKIADVYMVSEKSVGVPSHWFMYVNERATNTGTRYDVGIAGGLRSFLRVIVPLRYLTIFDGFVVPSPSSLFEVQINALWMIKVASFNAKQWVLWTVFVLPLSGLDYVPFSLAFYPLTFNCYKWTAEAASLALLIQIFPIC